MNRFLKNDPLILKQSFIIKMKPCLNYFPLLFLNCLYYFKVMKRFVPLYFVSLAALVFSCRPARNLASATDDGKIQVVFELVNDVYEIAPLSGGKEGGMA